MSNALLRRKSSKQGLQNLMRLTAQRSIEDAEEVERERRRRAREASHWTNRGSPENDPVAENDMYHRDLKPSSSPSLEEDEGFSDWTQRRERRRQQRLQELNQGAEEEDDDNEVTANKVTKTSQASIPSPSHLQGKEQEEVARNKQDVAWKQEREEDMVQAERVRRQKEREEDEKRKGPDPEVEKKKEVKISYTSKVFLHHEPKHNTTQRETTSQDVTLSIHNKMKRCSSRGVEPEEVAAILETEQRLEKIWHSLQQKESQELEQLRQRQAEAEQELEELKRRREERRRLREKEEHRREEDERQRLTKEEEERKQMKKDIERRRMEAAERKKHMSNMEGVEKFSPLSPKTSTHKITERTESLNRSLKKSNSFKKTQPLVLLPKIDDKMEQYASAVENSQDVRAVKASLTDLPSSPEVIASKKTLFEAREAWGQNPTKGASSKNTEGLKVGVANLITQWVRGPSDDSRQPLCRPTDVKSGDVMQKKNMWEVIGDTSEQPVHRAKASAAGKKYKFVITGHGKYEKIAVDDEAMNGKSDSYLDD